MPSPNWLDGLQRNVRRLADTQQSVRSLRGELEQSTRLLCSIVVLQRTKVAAPQSPRLELGRRGKLAEHIDFDGRLVQHLFIRLRGASGSTSLAEV